MTAKEYLQQLRWKNARINSLLERQARYRDLATRRTASYRGMPGGGVNRVSSVEEYACKAADLAREIDRRIDEYVDLTREIEAAIGRVPDARYRELLRLRYISEWSWEKIAVEMRYDERWVKQLHGYALLWIHPPAERQHENALFP